MPNPSDPRGAPGRRVQIAPLDPLRFAPTAERPVRAKARQMASTSEIVPHHHPWAQVAFAISGVSRISTDDSTYLVPGSRAVWIPGGVTHTVRAVEAGELRTLYVQAELCGMDGPPWNDCRVVEVSALLRELVLQMSIEMDSGAAADPALLERERRLGELALDELRRAAPLRLGIDLPRDKRLRALCEAVLAHPGRHATLEAWAAQAGASTRTVARLFRQELGTSFGPWRQQVLLAHAMTLAARGRPMAAIASDLGYASASAFTAMVRRSVGAPPGRFFASSP